MILSCRKINLKTIYLSLIPRSRRIMERNSYIRTILQNPQCFICSVPPSYRIGQF